MCYGPKDYSFLIGKFFHAPSTLKSAGDKVHGDEDANIETVNELSGTTCISIANACINGKHYNIKSVCNLSNIFSLTEETLLSRAWINQSEFLRDNGSTRIIVIKETGIPVIKVARMEDFPVRNLYNP